MGGREQLAIVGASCRLPGGVSSLDSLWSLLSEGRDAVTEIPDERWDKSLFLHNNPSEPGKTYTFSAGVLDDIKGFDAAFFGISPREALALDPQQRWLLALARAAWGGAGR